MDKIIKFIKETSFIEVNQSFELAKKCSLLLRKNTENANTIIVYILENWDKLDKFSREIWIDLIESAGFYPYLNKYGLNVQSTASQIRKELHYSEKLELYYHEEQKELLKKIKNKKNLIISAPTSFGKSLLIQEVIAENLYKNIVIIQPTLALLDETRKKLLDYQDKYKVIVKTSQLPSDNLGNIFLLTAERVLEYKNLPSIDFLVIDEFYKLSAKRDDERSDILNNAFYTLLKKNSLNFLLLGPNIEGISEGFIEKYNAEFYLTKYSLVANEQIDMYLELEKLKEYTNLKKKEKELFKQNKLYELLYDLKEEQTLIFCSSPSVTRKLAKGYMMFLKEKKDKNLKIKEEIPLQEWIVKNIDKNWEVNNWLFYRIGIHDGTLPKHITSSIIKYFNSSILKCLFCTTTIIEGVNTNTKNIIYYSNTKGRNVPIDYFDYSNIKGRSGRMMLHLVGKIFNFNKPPHKEKIIIDIPFFEQTPISEEVLINIYDKEIKNPFSEENKYLNSLDKEIKDLIKKNGVLVRGQEKIINEMMTNFNYKLINWTHYPSYEQLEYILNLAWDNLLKTGETTSPITKSRLIYLIFNFVRTKDINFLIKDLAIYKKNKGSKDPMNEAIKELFQINRHWFQYKVPKWLSVMNNIQEYVCKRKNKPSGSYLYYLTQLENDFIPENLALLSEFNIPKSAIKKIEKFIPNSMKEEEVLSYIEKEKILLKSNLIKYEKQICQENLFARLKED